MKYFYLTTPAILFQKINAGTHSINQAHTATLESNPELEIPTEETNDHEGIPITPRSWENIGEITNALDQRGCWCNFQPENVFNGRGPALDSWDSACKDLTNSYFCIVQEMKEQNGLICEPWATTYNYPGMGNQNSGNTPNFSIATDDVVKSCREHNLSADECSLKACYVEMYFAQQISKIMFSANSDLGKINKYKHGKKGFDFESSCPHVVNPNNQDIKCCGIYPIRFPFRGDDRKCCGNIVYSETFHECCDAASSQISISC